MLIVATLVMAVGAAVQAAVGFGLALFVVPLLALIDTRLVPGRQRGLSLIGLCVGTTIGAWGLSLIAPASLTKLFALLILMAVLISLLRTGGRVSRGALLAAVAPQASWARWLEFMARRSRWCFRTPSRREHGRCWERSLRSVMRCPSQPWLWSACLAGESLRSGCCCHPASASVTR